MADIGSPRHSGLLSDVHDPTHTHGPEVPPPGFKRSLPFNPLEMNASDTIGTTTMLATKASSANPMLACSAGKVG